MQTAVTSQDSEAGLRAITQLRRDMDVLERAHIRRALDSGRSWSQIAVTLGISKQAAHRKHRATPSLADPTLEELVQSGGPSGKVLVTGEARTAVRFARAEAQALGHASVGSEHLLLGLMRGEHSAARSALETAGVVLDAARVAAEPTLVEQAPADVAEEQSVPPGAFRPHAREVLEQSLAETVQRGEGFIGPEHLLLAILSCESAGAVRTLAALGVEGQDVRECLEELLSAPMSAAESTTRRSG